MKLLNDYRCPKCEKVYELLVDLKSKPKCPRCKTLLQKQWGTLIVLNPHKGKWNKV